MLYRNRQVFDDLFTRTYFPRQVGKTDPDGTDDLAFSFVVSGRARCTITTDPLIEYAVRELGAVVSEVPVEPAPRPDFESWLQSPVGQAVQAVIRRRASRDYRAAFDETGDVEQRSLIWLWQKYQTDPEWFTDPDHHPGYMGKAAVRSSRCKYTYRQYLLHTPTECTTSLNYTEGEREKVGLTWGDAATDILPHDRGYLHVDRRLDVARAIYDSIAALVETESQRPNRARGQELALFEQMLKTIAHGMLHYYEGQVGGGKFGAGAKRGLYYEYCQQRGVSVGQVWRWHKRLVAELSTRLPAYA